MDYQEKTEKTNIVIPCDFTVPNVRTIFDYVNSNKRCVFVAKGPSARHIEEYVDFGHIATVNEACLLVPNGIDFAFFYDKDALENSKPAWGRIKTFVMSAVLYGETFDDDCVPITEIEGLPLDRVLTFYEDQHDWDHEKVKASMQTDRFINTDTATMGLHFLLMNGYKEILLLGHDGGIGYAEGVCAKDKKREMSRFRDMMELVSKEFEKKYNSKIRFFKENE